MSVDKKVKKKCANGCAMPRGRPRKRLTITLDDETIAWLREQMDRKVFSSLSHGLERCVQLARESKKI